ncbi:MAG TPA: hypothetical protein VFJ14_15825 [Nocardioidaceae bacterium]|nr:hypothetical protein [Nocardioidaceae bacterium]
MTKLLVLVAAAFAVFYLLTDPEGAADAVRGAGEAVLGGLEQLVRFATRLFS